MSTSYLLIDKSLLITRVSKRVLIRERTSEENSHFLEVTGMVVECSVNALERWAGVSVRNCYIIYSDEICCQLT